MWFDAGTITLYVLPKHRTHNWVRNVLERELAEFNAQLYEIHARIEWGLSFGLDVSYWTALLPDTLKDRDRIIGVLHAYDRQRANAPRFRPEHTDDDAPTYERKGYGYLRHARGASGGKLRALCCRSCKHHIKGGMSRQRYESKAQIAKQRAIREARRV